MPGRASGFETAIRKRPLAVQNEGDSTAFVTCSFTAQGRPANNTYLNPTAVMVNLASVNGSAKPREHSQRLSCADQTLR